MSVLKSLVTFLMALFECYLTGPFPCVDIYVYKTFSCCSGCMSGFVVMNMHIGLMSFAASLFLLKYPRTSSYHDAVTIMFHHHVSEEVDCSKWYAMFSTTRKAFRVREILCWSQMNRASSPTGLVENCKWDFLCLSFQFPSAIRIGITDALPVVLVPSPLL